MARASHIQAAAVSLSRPSVWPACDHHHGGGPLDMLSDGHVAIGNPWCVQSLNARRAVPLLVRVRVRVRVRVTLLVRPDDGGKWEVNRQ